jgi:hypothetical protein
MKAEKPIMTPEEKERLIKEIKEKIKQREVVKK